MSPAEDHHGRTGPSRKLAGQQQWPVGGAAAASLLGLGCWVLWSHVRRDRSSSRSHQEQGQHVRRQDLTQTGHGSVASTGQTSTHGSSAAITQTSSSTSVNSAGSSRPEFDSKEVAALRSQYDSLAADFAAHNVDVSTIQQLEAWFVPGVSCWPKRYDQMEPPFPPCSVRLLVVPLADSPSMCAFAAAATTRVAALLPQGSKIFSIARAQYHCTLFHTSHPCDPRPDPFSVDGGLGPQPAAPTARPAVTETVLACELEAVQQAVGSTPLLQLEAHSLVMTRTGTLLLTWVDHSGQVSGLRQRLRHTFPGATSKQANIIHTTLLRILTPEPLPADVVTRINAACCQLTDTCRGRTFTAKNLWWIEEVEYSTVIGPRHVIPLLE